MDVLEVVSQIFQSILRMDFVSTLIEILIGVIMVIVSVVLLPVTILIEALFPGFNASLDSLNTTLQYALTHMGWIISAFGIPSMVITLMIAYYMFAVNSKLALWGFKLALKWYSQIKG